MAAQHSVSVAAVITNDAGEVLLIQRKDNGHWEPPGGVLEVDEPIHEGLRREVAEETGLLIQPDRLTGVYKNMVRAVVALVFRAHVVGGSQQPSGTEAAAVAWVSPDQVTTLCDEAYAVRILDGLRDGIPSVRAHDGTRLLPRRPSAAGLDP